VPVSVGQARPAIGRVSIAVSGPPGSIAPLDGGVVYSHGQALITALSPPNSAFPEQATLRLRNAAFAATFGEAATTTTLATVRQADGQTVQGTLDLTTQLGTALSGQLQVQVYDARRQVGSDWVTLSDRFVPSASIEEIDCPRQTPASSAAVCTLYGDNLSRIQSISDGSDTSAPEPCARPAVADRGCMLVKDYRQYIVTMYGHQPFPRFAVSEAVVHRNDAPSRMR